MDSGSNGSFPSPRRPLDFIVGGLIASACIPFIIGNIIIVVHRDYRPIKTKAVDLTVLSSVGGLIWILATVVVNDHFGRPRDTFWSFCVLWTFWLQASMGFALWLICMIVRLLNLHLIFCVKVERVKRWTHVVLPLLLLLTPVVTYSTIASVFHASKFQEPDINDTGEGDCKIVNRGWSIGLLVLLPVYFFIFLALAFSLRNIMAQYNEFRLIRNGGIMSVFLFLLSLVTLQTQAYTEVTGRCFLSVSVSAAVFYYFWARNASVIYNVLFHKEEFSRQFNESLQAYSSGSNSRELYPDLFPNMEALLQQARAEALGLRIHVQELEDKLSSLEAACRQLQGEAAVEALVEVS